MERDRPPQVATFFAEGALVAGAFVDLGEHAVHHLRVRRVAAGEHVMLTNGEGRLAHGVVARVAKNDARVEVETASDVPAPPMLRLFPPVADRDRLLWLAEKAAELSVSVWQPVRFRRSLSVASRGEGEAFQRKVRARMVSALEQSGGAWLPVLSAEVSLVEALAMDTSASPVRYVLERTGRPLAAGRPSQGADVMIGPEGGFEASELEQIVGASWVPVSLGDNTLRFETAAILAAGIIRAQLAISP